MKVLLLTPCVLPVPAVKGGAVLDLVETLIKENDIYYKLDLSVVSSFDEKAVVKANDYKYTKFHFIKKNILITLFDKIIDSILSFGKKKYQPHMYLWKMHVLSIQKKIMLNNNYDAIVFENSGFLLNSLKNKKVLNKYKGKIFYHLHNDIPNNIFVDGLRECKVLSISHYLKNKIDYLCNNFKNDNFLVLHNGFDCNQFSNKLSDLKKYELLKTLGISEDKKIVVFAGRIDAAKGIDKLVDAIELLDRDDVVLLVMGAHNFGSGQTSYFEDMMKKKFDAMKGRVVFTGYINHEDIWMYYKLADLAVLPSMWEEPAGLTIMESMASGLPVISTISGGIPEFLSEEFGILLERDENIVDNIRKNIDDVLNNLNSWKKKGKKASNYILDIASKKTYYDTFVNYLIDEAEK